MPEPQIFKATYSGIPVYEMMCKGVAVMRRRADSWLNATQILKVAGFDKPQRTRVLEREIQKGEHEKVQGGYGKYQGTWIPMERGLSLAKQYGCDVILRPIIEFQETSKSPPPAPKHVAASASTARTPATRREAVSIATRSSKKQVAVPAVEASEISTEVDSLSVVGSEDGSMTPSPSLSSASSRTPSPIRERSPHPSKSNDDRQPVRGRVQKQRRKAGAGGSHEDEYSDDGGKSPRTNGNSAAAKEYAEQILDYFISDSNHIPDILVHPPADFDPNMTIDDDGHTPLHWACAMGRIRVLKLLLSAGADSFAVNKSGQTALMRSVMFSNNYDVRKFPELYELLHKSTLNIDNYNRTVFHHIVDLAMSKGKTHASRYYMETLLTRLEEYPRELADVINFQDEDGETALTLAARCRSKRLVRILIDHGADPKLANNDGKTAEDYILEDERFRASPGPPSSRPYRSHHSSYPPSSGPGSRPPIHHSATAQKASSRCVNDMTTLLDNLASSFDIEIRDKEKDITQAHALLGNIQSEILESQRTVGHIKVQAEGLGPAKARLKVLEDELMMRMNREYRMGFECWFKQEERRERRIREGGGGVLVLTQETERYGVEDREEEQRPGESSKMRGSPMRVDAAGGSNNGDREPPQQGATNTPTPPATEKSLGKRKATSPPPTYPEDITDLLALHSSIPSSPAALRKACEELMSEISQGRKRRRELFEEYVACQAEAGTSARMKDYRRLIGVGCGGISGDEVDGVVEALLESLEEEEPSSSAAAWVG